MLVLPLWAALAVAQPPDVTFRASAQEVALDLVVRDKHGKLVKNLKPEFTPTPNVPGIVSMARGAEADSATSSFFICTGDCRSLDNQYTVFAEIESGMDIAKAIEAVAVNGEAPVEPVKVVKISVVAR